MRDFVGFKREHFEFFVFHNDDDARPWILKEIRDFAAKVNSALQTFEPSFYKELDDPPHKWTDSYWWFAFGPASKENPKATHQSKENRKVTHQSISISADGLAIAVNAELQPATDRIKRLIGRDGVALFDEIVRFYGEEPIEITFWERKQYQVRLFHYLRKLRLYSPILTDSRTRGSAWNALSELIRTIPLFQLNIARILEPSTLIKESGEAVVERVVEIMKRNHSMVKLLNDNRPAE